MGKLIKFLLVFLIIFTVSAIITTYILIQNNKQNVVKEPDNYNEIIVQNERGINLDGTYNENDLIIAELLETYSGEEVKIPQISGLKDSKIEKKINKEIYDKCLDLIHSFETYDSESYTNYSVMANFSNVLSINYYASAGSSYEHIYFNYNLVTGERLKFEDLFLKDADIVSIVRQAFSKRLSNNNYWDNVIEGDYIASFDENELYKGVKGFMESEEKDFMFSPSELYIYHKNNGSTIDIIDIAESVSIYTKYLTNESIFIKNDIGRKNIFTLVETNYDMFDTIDYGYLEDNLWYDVTINKMYFPDENIEDEKMQKFNSYAKNIKNEVYNKVNEYREKAKENKDKFYILICLPNISMYNDGKYENGEWTYTYSNMAIASINTKIYEMPIELYNKEYKDKILNAYRHEYFVMRGGMYYTIDEPNSGDGVVYIKEEEQRKYNYMTNTEIKELSEIFYEDVNYMETIEEIVRNEIRKNYQYYESKIEEILKSAKYEFDGWNISVKIPQIEYFRLNIYLETFDKSMLNIFEKED